MTEEKLKQFKDTLSRHHNDLVKLVDSKSAGKGIHLQGATVKEMLEAVSQFKEALERIDKGNFGKCSVCSGEVELERLCQDFTTSVCLDHYNEEEIRGLEKDLELTAEFQRKLLPCCLLGGHQHIWVR